MGLDGLQRTVLDDFAAGSNLNVAPHLIPPNGAYSIENGLLLREDGSVDRRGGSKAKTNAVFGASTRFLWDGWLQPGHRTVFANVSDFGVLADDDATPLNIGGTGITLPRVPRVIEDLMFIPTNPVTIYGGSRKVLPMGGGGADYSAGTALPTNGSKIVVGTGTAWLANVDVGMLYRTGSGERVYIVASVQDDTHLTLRDAYEAPTGVTRAYTLKVLETATAPYKSAQILGSIADRLIVVEENNIVRMTERSKPHSYIDTDFHELSDGLNIIAVEALGTDLIVFHTQGYTLIRNMAFNLTDALGALQQREESPNRDLVSWGGSGIAGYRSGLVVPAVDGIYLVDGISQPVPLERSIGPRYRAHVEAGYQPGQATVHRDHYFLPIIDASAAPKDLLVCRLDRPVRTRSQTIFPWTWQKGAGAEVTAMVSRAPAGAGAAPSLLGADTTGITALTDCSDFFDPSAAVKVDHDGKAHKLTIVCRDVATGPVESINRVRRARLIRECVLADGDDGFVSADIGGGRRDNPAPQWGQVQWGHFKWTSSDAAEYKRLRGEAGADDGRGGFNFYAAKRTRYARLRLRSSGPIARLTIRSLEIFTSVGGRVRHTRTKEPA